MRTLHFLIKLVVAAAIITGGVFVFLYPVSHLWDILATNMPDNDLYRQILAVAGGVGIFLLFVPLWPKRGPKERTFAFQGTHGEVTVDLEPVEATLERVLNKLPEVKWVTVRIEPQESDTATGKVLVFVKGSFRREDTSDVRHTSSWIQSFVKSRTQKMLGVQSVEIKLRLKNQPTNMKSVKPEPLLLEGPRGEQRAASTGSMATERPAPAASATAPAAATASQAAEEAGPPPPEPEPRAEVEPEEPEAAVAADSEEESPGAIPTELMRGDTGFHYQSPAFEAVSEESVEEREEDEEEAQASDDEDDEAPVAWSPDRDNDEDRRQSPGW